MHSAAKEFSRDSKRFFLVLTGGFLMAVNLVIFVKPADLFPGGFSGITLLLQDIFQKEFNLHLLYSLTVYAFNLVPAIIGFKYIGKRFTFFSVVMIFISGLFTDLLSGLGWPLLTDDILLCAVFGGILNAVAVVLCLLAESSSGGTDFIAIYISEKTGRSAWNLIFGFNCLILFFAGLSAGWNKALYSIIFQYTSSQVINLLYKKYSKITLLIITDKSEEVYRTIKQLTNHGATVFEGRGEYSGKNHKLVYTVVSAAESGKLEKQLRTVDPTAFINVIQSKDILGRFFRRHPD